MSEKTGIEKLRILLPHWIDHNNSHIEEFSKWKDVAADEAGEKAISSTPIFSESIRSLSDSPVSAFHSDRCPRRYGVRCPALPTNHAAHRLLSLLESNWLRPSGLVQQRDSRGLFHCLFSICRRNLRFCRGQALDLPHSRALWPIDPGFRRVFVSRRSCKVRFRKRRSE